MKTKSRLRYALSTVIILFYLPFIGVAQEQGLYAKAYQLPDKLFSGVTGKSLKLQQQLNRSTAKYLKKLARQEHKMYSRMARKDSATAATVFGDINGRYDSLNKALYSSAGSSQNVYSPYLDSMQTALKFLDQQSGLSQSTPPRGKVKDLMHQYSGAQGKLNQTKVIEEQLKQRQAMIKSKLESSGLMKEFKAYQSRIYYFRQQVSEYKELFETPAKLEARLLKEATKLPAFQKFFNKHSQLSSLFRLPGSDDDIAISDPSLQSRSMVLEDLERRLGTGPNVEQYMASNIGDAQRQLSKAKDRLNKLGSAGADMDMPDFKRNEEKTKSFLKRIELSTNIQSTKSNSFFPATTDLGMSVGYKFSQKSSAGFGFSYKLGLGSDIRHIQLSSEGVGLRTYLDMKIKGSFFASGGLEYNYQRPFSTVRTLYQTEGWSESGLLGISKIVSLRSKTFKKTKFQLLFDFLSFDAVPRRQPVIFRANYGLR